MNLLETPRRAGIRRAQSRAAARSASAILAHDLASPIAAIRLSASALRMSDALSNRELAAVRRIEAAAAMAARLLAGLQLSCPDENVRPARPASAESLDLYVVCCELAQAVRRSGGGTIICRAFGDPRGSWNRDLVQAWLSEAVELMVAQFGRGAPLTIAVTGLTKYVRIDIHGFGWLSPEKRESCMASMAKIGVAVRGATTTGTVSRNSGCIFTLRLPR